MSQAIEAIAYHGWGFDQQCWASWKTHFAEHGIALQTFDRGYFGESHAAKFANHSHKVVMVHSYGLHLCPPEHLSQADLLVIFASFVQFHPQGERDKRRSQRVLQQMIQGCQQHPQAVLDQFYTNCGLPPDHDLRNRTVTNHDQLVIDLQGLNTARFEIHQLNSIPNIVIFHGVMDQIVPHSKGEEWLESLPNQTDLFLISNAEHALPFTHTHECWQTLSEKFL
ncbi:alpha/beta hydrolase [Oscillatoria sp. FACHB-1407]|uniref:alpha/beta hydrolase n=1 Tax=Oscillatoria sp. FACHB-1407 TaxID=2692847 RepID=UPI001685DF90|nr:alpha/beta hydrolase [Oscillatoria sp. FACHB-1407]MBD2462320.1 alpha/beta hydrolase [Oscillatoria sp. FACHB-1407]